MKANELMIDDWVKCVDSTHTISMFAQVDAIEEGHNCILVKRDISNWFLDIKYLEPIPLTNKILEKNGFVKVDGAYQDVFYCCDGLDLLIDDRLEPWGYTLYGVFELQIKYLHELQHALRLGGINKEIKL